MLRLNRAPAPSHARYAPARADRKAQNIRRAQSARVTAAATEPGPACKHLLGLDDTNWQGLMDLVTPGEQDAALLESVVDKVKSGLDKLFINYVKVEFVGPTAAGIALPDAVPSMVVQLENYTAARHDIYLEAVHCALVNARPLTFRVAEPASRPQGHSFECFMSSGRGNGAPEHFMLSVSGTKPPSLAELMDPGARAGSSALNAAFDATLRAAFLQQQPALYKLAVRVVKRWARHCSSGAPDSREMLTKLPKCDPLLELLVLKAFQQYMDLAAQGSSSSTGTAVVAPQPDSPQAAAALDAILLKFLQISASLSARSLIYWSDSAVGYSKDTLLQVLATPRLISLLRPSSSEACPLVIDPVNPTHNAALLVSFKGPSDFRRIAQGHMNAISSIIVTSLQQRLLVAEAGLREQQLQVERLQGKLDQQSSLLQVLLANQAPLRLSQDDVFPVA